MKQYLDLTQHILDHGERKTNRTGIDTLSVFGTQTRYDLREGFPVLTTKKLLFDAVVRELLWFLRGSTNINDGLTQHTPIWNAWADDDGELGPIYGHAWRNFGARWVEGEGSDPDEGVDQIQQVIDQIKHNPDSRRIIVSAWDVTNLPHMRLPPCHLLFQFNVVDPYLDLHLYQRSADMALGVPFNIASYALLLELIAHECCLQPRHFVHTLGDAHIYVNHIEGLCKQLRREPKPLPNLGMLPNKPLDDIRFEDIELLDYEHHPFIRFKVAL